MVVVGKYPNTLKTARRTVLERLVAFFFVHWGGTLFTGPRKSTALMNLYRGCRHVVEEQAAAIPVFFFSPSRE